MSTQNPDVTNIQYEGPEADQSTGTQVQSHQGIVEFKTYTRSEAQAAFKFSEDVIPQLETLFGLQDCGTKTSAYLGRDLIRCLKHRNASGLTSKQLKARMVEVRRQELADESIFKALEKLDV